MIEIIRQFFDKKSPVFIITISFLITIIVALGYPHNDQLQLSKDLSLFEKVLLITLILQITFKTIGMEIFSRIAGRTIICIHIIVISLFLVVNILMFVWSVLLNLRIRKEATQAFTDEPHVFLLQIYSVVWGIVYFVIIGLLLGLKLENKTMTVLQNINANEQNKEYYDN